VLHWLRLVKLVLLPEREEEMPCHLLPGQAGCDIAEVLKLCRASSRNVTAEQKGRVTTFLSAG